MNILSHAYNMGLPPCEHKRYDDRQAEFLKQVTEMSHELTESFRLELRVAFDRKSGSLALRIDSGDYRTRREIPLLVLSETRVDPLWIVKTELHQMVSMLSAMKLNMTAVQQYRMNDKQTEGRMFRQGAHAPVKPKE